MKYVDLAGTDMTVSAIAYGTATIGTAIEKKESFELLDCFCENGGNMIDTAHCYANWLSSECSLSEKTIGEWMQQRNNRHSVFISTKGGHPNHKTPTISRLKESDILLDIDESLVNLKTDYVDIYFLHRDDESLPVSCIMETLNKIKQAGKARSIGLSNWTSARIEEAMDYCNEHFDFNITSSQIHFGIAHPNSDKIDPTTLFMTEKEYDWYARKKLNMFSFSSQSSGYFFTTDENGNPTNKVYDNEKSREKFTLVKKLSEKYDCSVAAIITSALSANSDFKTIPIIGGIVREQITDSLSGISVSMKDEDVKKLLVR